MMKSNKKYITNIHSLSIKWIKSLFLMMGALNSVHVQQGIHNLGQRIYVEPGTKLNVQGGYYNYANTYDGQIFNQGEISLTGNIQNNTNTAIFSNKGKVIFQGNQPKSIAGNPIQFHQLELNSSDTLHLNTDITIQDTLFLSQGNFLLTPGNIDLGLYGHLSGESETKRVMGDGLIKSERTIIANENVAGMGISFSKNVGTATIYRGHKPRTEAGDGSISRYFLFYPSAQIENVAVKINYLEAELDTLNENELDLWKSSDNIKWRRQYATMNLVNNEGTVVYSLLDSAIFTFSEGECDHPPLVNIGADTTFFCDGNTILLDAQHPGMEHLWSTADTSQSIIVGTTGNYFVSVTSINGCVGGDTTAAIEKPVPIAEFELSNYHLCQNDSIYFTDISTMSDNSSLSRWWDFGNPDLMSDTAIIKTPVFAYDTSGQFQVQLVVTSTYGCADTVEKFITSAPLPQAKFLAQDVCINNAMKFQNNSLIMPSSIGGYNYAIESLFWDFGNGNQSNSENPTHLYGDTGTFKVRLIATTNLGCKDSVTQFVQVHPRPNAQFNFTTACVNDSIEFINSSSHASIYQWNFGDDNTSSIANPFHAYTHEGNYTISLMAISPYGCSDTNIQNITPFSLPFTRLGDTIITCGSSYVLDPISPLGNTYLWANGSTNSTFNATQNGIYWVKVTSLKGCKKIDSVQVFLDSIFKPELGPPIVACDASNIDAFNPSSTYNWSTGQNSSEITVTATGSYWVEIHDQNDCVGNDTLQVTIHQSPEVNLGEDTTVCFVTTLLLDASNNGNTVLWSDNSTQQTLLVKNTGIYWVQVANDHCKTLDSIQINMDKSSYPELGEDRWLCNNGSLTLIAGTNPTSTYEWIHSRNFFSNQPSITLKDTGEYQVNVSSLLGCEASDTIRILPSPYSLNAEFLATSTINEGDTLQFIAVAAPANLIDAYSWSFGDGVKDIIKHPQHIYFLPKTYQAQLIVTNAYCADTIINPITVLPLQKEKIFIEGPGPLILPEILQAKLYPNPNKGQFTVELELNQEARIQMQLLNLNGQLLDMQEYTAESFLKNFDYGSLQPGIYLFHIATNHQHKTIKWVKL